MIIVLELFWQTSQLLIAFCLDKITSTLRIIEFIALPEQFTRNSHTV